MVPHVRRTPEDLRNRHRIGNIARCVRVGGFCHRPEHDVWSLMLPLDKSQRFPIGES